MVEQERKVAEILARASADRVFASKGEDVAVANRRHGRWISGLRRMTGKFALTGERRFLPTGLAGPC